MVGRHAIIRRVTGAVVAIATLTTAIAAAPPPTAGASPDTTRFEPVVPCRLLDTRTAGPLAPATDVVVQVAGRCGVPAEATAAALTITATDAGRDGFLTAWPSGPERPEASNLNLTAGETRANSAIVRLGGGSIDVHTDAGGHVLVDVTGAFVPTDTATAGRFEPIEPARLVDTRGTGRPAPASSLTVPRPEAVPADAIALAANITTTESVGAGYFTAYATGGPVPEASVLNTDGPGQTRAASAIVPVGAAGFDVFTSVGDHVIVDVTGYFTGPSSADSADGLFVPADPTRALDTRTLGELAPGGPAPGELHPGEHALIHHPSGRRFAQLAGNVTMVVLPGEPGFATLCGPNPEENCGDQVSSVNADAGAVANGFVGLVVDETGEAWVRASTFAHVIVDVSGGFVGTPIAHLPWTPPRSPYHPPRPREHPAGPSDPWARGVAEECVPPAVLARLDAIDTRWVPLVEGPPGALGQANVVRWHSGDVVVDEFFWIELRTWQVDPDHRCTQVVPHEVMHILDYASGDPSQELHRFLGPLDEWQQAECLAQAIEILLVPDGVFGDGTFAYDDDDGIRTCSRSEYAVDLVTVLWDRIDGQYFQWSGDVVVVA